MATGSSLYFRPAWNRERAHRQDHKPIVRTVRTHNESRTTLRATMSDNDPRCTATMLDMSDTRGGKSAYLR